MTAAVALARLDAAGVRVRLRNDGSLNLTAAAPPPPAVLALARANRDGIAALLAGQGSQTARGGFVPNTPTAKLPLTPARTGFPSLPGVPPDWREGVTRLAIMPAPAAVPPWRWAVLTATSARLLRDHGAALHNAGWDTLDLFGLHRHAPAANPSGWGLAWLLGADGEVLDIGPDVVGLRRRPDGARLGFRQQGEKARAGIIPAWIIERTGP